MPITDITSDAEALTITVVGDYPVPVDRLWHAFNDPRQLERFWGPPEWPATFTRHDMVAGGRSEYFMTGPDGERSSGYWIIESVDEGRGFTVRDGFAADDGTSNDSMPSMTMAMRFEPTDGGSRFVSVTTFPDLGAMDQLVEMGMLDGTRAALGQLTDVLDDLASFARDRATDAQLLTDTKVRISRSVRGTPEQVWRAHHDETLLRRWMLGPDGWTLPVCDVASGVGDSYRYEWEADDGEQRFGFVGEVLESVPPRREVTTERLTGTDGPATHNEMTLTPIDDSTLLTIVITYPTRELRDQALDSGMSDGMEASYVRLEQALAGATVD